MVLCLDAANTKSYPGTGTTWSDLITTPLSIVTGEQAVDSSASAITLVTHNISFEDDIPAGATGKSIRFNSSDIGIPGDASYLLSGDFTIEFWAKFDVTQTFYAVLGGYQATLLGESGTLTDIGAPRGFNSDLVGGFGLDASTAHNDDTWRHYAFVKSGSTIYLYVDGSLDDSAADSSTYNFGTSNMSDDGWEWAFTIGRSGEPYYPAGDNYMRGNIYQITLATTARYTSAFTPSIDLTNDADTLWFIEVDDVTSEVGPFNATLVNSPTYSSTNGGIFEFDGVNNTANIGDLSSQIAEHKDITISFWGKVNDTTSDQVFFSVPDVGSNKPITVWYDVTVSSRDNTGGSDIGGATSDTISVMITDSAAEFIYTATEDVIQQDAWNYYCVVIHPSDDKFYLYVNAEVVALFNSSTCDGIKDHSDDFVLAAGAADIAMSAFRIYNRALTATEIQQNFQALRGRYGI